MKRATWIAVFSLVACFISGYFGYRLGQRSPLRLPGKVAVYGCGVDRVIHVKSETPVLLRTFVSRLQPLPSEVNGALIQTTNGNYYCRLGEMSDTNGIGRLPLFGGESITLVHRED